MLYNTRRSNSWGGEHSCYELKNNNTTCYIPLWKKSVSGGNYHTPLTIKKNNTEYWVDTLVPQTVNLNYYARDNVTDYTTVTTLPQSNIDELTGIIASSDASYAFYNCRALTTLNGVETTWDTSNVTNMREMFESCFALTSLDLSNWDTSNVTNMFHMFSGCESLTSLNLTGWNVSNIYCKYSAQSGIHGMFVNCKSLTSLDLAGWNVSSIYYVDSLFNSLINLKVLDLSNWGSTLPYTNSKFRIDNFFPCVAGYNIIKSDQLEYLILNDNTNTIFGLMSQADRNDFHRETWTGYNSRSMAGLFAPKYTGLNLDDVTVPPNLKVLVPANMVNAYKQDTIWSHIADHIYSIDNFNITKSNGQITVTPK